MSEFAKNVAINLVKKVSPANLLKLAGGPLGVVHLVLSFPIGFQLSAVNAQPEHWKFAQVKGFDQAYRNYASLVNFENQAFSEAGWRLTGDQYTGPNILFMGISIVLLTLVCSSAIALVALI